MAARPSGRGAHRASGGTIVVKDFAGRHEAKPALVTNDIGEAVRGAELIMRPTPATAQAESPQRWRRISSTARSCSCRPGRSARCCSHRPRAMPATAPRWRSPRPARCRGSRASTGRSRWRSPCAPNACRPASSRCTRKDHALALLRTAFPGAIEDCGDALSAALMNAGPIIHPPLIIMNAGAARSISSAGTSTRREPSRPSAASPMRSTANASRCAKRWATVPPHFPLADHYAREGEEWMYGRGSHDRLTDSGDWREHIVLTQHRYMLEDTRIGLSFLHLGRRRSPASPTPLARAFLEHRFGDLRRGFHADRTYARRLGLGGLDRHGLQAPAARRVCVSTREPIACLGAGRMGRGIAVVFAYAGHDVAVVDFKPRATADFERLAALARRKSARRWRASPSFGLFEESSVDRDRRPRVRGAGERSPRRACPPPRSSSRACRKCSTSSARCWRAPPRSPDRSPIIASTTSTILADDLAGAVVHPAALPQRALAQPGLSGAAGGAVAVGADRSRCRRAAESDAGGDRQGAGRVRRAARLHRAAHPGAWR